MAHRVSYILKPALPPPTIGFTKHVLGDSNNKTKLDYNAFNVYRRELAPGTVSLTGDRAQGDDSKHWANSKCIIKEL